MEPRLRAAHLRAEATHLRAAETHARAAELYERLGQHEKAALEYGREEFELRGAAIERGRMGEVMLVAGHGSSG